MKTTAGIIAGITFSFMKLQFVPDLNLLGWVFVAMLFDFITGVMKAKLNKEPITSKRFRESVVKALQYIGVMVGCIILGNTVKENNELVRWINDGMMIFIIYVEVYSIIENFRDMNPASKMSKLVFTPLLGLLSLTIAKNPLINILQIETKKDQVHESSDS